MAAPMHPQSATLFDLSVPSLNQLSNALVFLSHEVIFSEGLLYRCGRSSCVCKPFGPGGIKTRPLKRPRLEAATSRVVFMSVITCPHCGHAAIGCHRMSAEFSMTVEDAVFG
jgi:hypothetical protein